MQNVALEAYGLVLAFKHDGRWQIIDHISVLEKLSSLSYCTTDDTDK